MAFRGGETEGQQAGLGPGKGPPRGSVAPSCGQSAEKPVLPALGGSGRETGPASRSPQSAEQFRGRT